MFYHTFLLGREVSLLCSYWSTRFLYFFHQKVPTKYNPLMFSGANGRRPWLVSQREHQRLHNMAPQCSRQTQVFVSIYICICRYMYTYIQVYFSHLFNFARFLILICQALLIFLIHPIITSKSILSFVDYFQAGSSLKDHFVLPYVRLL